MSKNIGNEIKDEDGKIYKLKDIQLFKNFQQTSKDEIDNYKLELKSFEKEIFGLRQENGILKSRNEDRDE